MVRLYDGTMVHGVRVHGMVAWYDAMRWYDTFPGQVQSVRARTGTGTVRVQKKKKKIVAHTGIEILIRNKRVAHAVHSCLLAAGCFVYFVHNSSILILYILYLISNTVQHSIQYILIQY